MEVLKALCYLHSAFGVTAVW